MEVPKPPRPLRRFRGGAGVETPGVSPPPSEERPPRSPRRSFADPRTETLERSSRHRLLPRGFRRETAVVHLRSTPHRKAPGEGFSSERSVRPGQKGVDEFFRDTSRWQAFGDSDQTEL
jgi:hypothetical protein